MKTLVLITRMATALEHKINANGFKTHSTSLPSLIAELSKPFS